jgi:hypothetical protein
MTTSLSGGDFRRWPCPCQHRSSGLSDTELAEARYHLSRRLLLSRTNNSQCWHEDSAGRLEVASNLLTEAIDLIAVPFAAET